jgi:hypothetical protein
MTNLTLRQIIYQRHFLMSIVDLHFDKYIRARHANHHNRHIDIKLQDIIKIIAKEASMDKKIAQNQYRYAYYGDLRDELEYISP